MSPRPAAGLRRDVAERADGRCEYCLFPQDAAAARHQVDHVIAEKHRGATTSENLALSCVFCNRRKGSDLSSIDPLTGDVVPLFHPRFQAWAEHFRLDGARIIGITPEARATVELLEFNTSERLLERHELIASGRYP